MRSTSSAWRLVFVFSKTLLKVSPYSIQCESELFRYLVHVLALNQKRGDPRFCTAQPEEQAFFHLIMLCSRAKKGIAHTPGTAYPFVFENSLEFQPRSTWATWTSAGASHYIS